MSPVILTVVTWPHTCDTLHSLQRRKTLPCRLHSCLLQRGPLLSWCIPQMPSSPIWPHVQQLPSFTILPWHYHSFSSWNKGLRKPFFTCAAPLPQMSTTQNFAWLPRGLRIAFSSLEVFLTGLSWRTCPLSWLVFTPLICFISFHSTYHHLQLFF